MIIFMLLKTRGAFDLMRRCAEWHQSTTRADGSLCFRITLAVIWCHSLIIQHSAASSQTHLITSRRFLWQWAELMLKSHWLVLPYYGPCFDFNESVWANTCNRALKLLGVFDMKRRCTQCSRGTLMSFCSAPLQLHTYSECLEWD